MFCLIPNLAKFFYTQNLSVKNHSDYLGKGGWYRCFRNPSINIAIESWDIFEGKYYFKHCQRQNEPKGWVHLSKATYWFTHKFKHRSWSNFIFKISTKHLLKNLNQTSPSRLNLKLKILTEPSFSISIRIQLRNRCKISKAK